MSILVPVVCSVKMRKMKQEKHKGDKMKSSFIIQEAKEVKQFMEKNKVLPKFCTINNNTYSIYTTTYLFAKFLQNRTKKDVAIKNIKQPNVNTKSTINEKVLPNDYLDMTNRFVRYCEANKKVPSYVLTKKSKTKVSFDLFTYCLSKIITFYSNNSNTLPAYCVFNSSDIQNKKTTNTTTKKTTATSTSTGKNNCKNPFTSSPHYTTKGCNKLGQCTGYYCAPHSIHQAIKKFGITQFTEKQIASWAGTTSAGTGHPGVNTAIAKISKESGIKLKVQWKNFSDMGATDKERFANIAKILCKSNTAIIWHILYINGGSGTSGKGFGHYECIDKINTSTNHVRALNSLGDKKSDGSYKGRLQDRAYAIQAYFARNTNGNQPALCIITKEK